MFEANIYDIGYHVEEAASSYGQAPYAMKWLLRKYAMKKISKWCNKHGNIYVTSSIRDMQVWLVS